MSFGGDHDKYQDPHIFLHYKKGLGRLILGGSLGDFGEKTLPNFRERRIRKACLEEDLEIARRQVIHLYRDLLVSHFDFVFILCTIHFHSLDFYVDLCIECGYWRLHIWFLDILFFICGFFFLIFFTLFILIAYEVF